MIRTEDINKELQPLNDKTKILNSDSNNLKIILSKMMLKALILIVKILRDMKINQMMIMKKWNVPFAKRIDSNKNKKGSHE